MVWASLLQPNQLESITQTILVSSWSELVELATQGLAIKVDLNQPASFEQAYISGSYRGSLTVDGTTTDLSGTAAAMPAGMPGGSYWFSGAGTHNYGPVVPSVGVPTNPVGYTNYGSFFQTLSDTLYTQLTSGLSTIPAEALTLEGFKQELLSREISASIQASPEVITLKGFNEKTNLTYYAANYSSPTVPNGSSSFTADELSIQLTDAFFDDWMSYLETTPADVNPVFTYNLPGTATSFYPIAYTLDFSSNPSTGSALWQLENSVLSTINLQIGIDESMLESGKLEVVLKGQGSNGNPIYQTLFGTRWDDDGREGSTYSLGLVDYQIDPTTPAATRGATGANNNLAQFFRTSTTWFVDSIRLSDFGPDDTSFEFSTANPAPPPNTAWSQFPDQSNLFNILVTGGTSSSRDVLNNNSDRPLFNFIGQSAYDIFNGSTIQNFDALAAGTGARARFYYKSTEKSTTGNSLVTGTIYFDPINGVYVEKPNINSEFNSSSYPEITLNLSEIKIWAADYSNGYGDQWWNNRVFKSIEISDYNFVDGRIDWFIIGEDAINDSGNSYIRLYDNSIPNVLDETIVDLWDIFAVLPGQTPYDSFEAIRTATFSTANLNLDPTTTISSTDWSFIIPPADPWDSHRAEPGSSPAISFNYGLEKNGVPQDLQQLAVTGDSVDPSEVYKLNIFADTIDYDYGLNSINLRIKYNADLFDDIQASDITFSEKLPLFNAVKIDRDNGYIYLQAGAGKLDSITYGDGARTLLASIKLNFNENYLNSANTNDDGGYTFNPLSFEIIANQDETTLTQFYDDGTGFDNTETFTLRDLLGNYDSFGTDVTLYSAFINLEEIEGMKLGTQRVIGSDAAFTNLIRSGDIVTATSIWENVGNIRADDLLAFNTYTNDNGYLLDYSFSTMSIESGKFIEGLYDGSTRETTTLTASIHVTGTAGNVLNTATDGIFYVNAYGSADFRNTLGSKNLITFAGDLNYDGRVSMKDLAYLNAGAARQQLITSPDGPATTVVAGSLARDVDANFDGRIDLADLAVLDADWGKTLHTGIEGSFLGSGNHTSQITWEQLDSQGTATWNNTVFKEQNALEASPSFIGSLESPLSTGVIGADGNSDPYDNDYSGGFFQGQVLV